MAYPTVTLTGKYVHVDGTAAKGSVDIRPTSSPIKDAAGNVVLAGGKKVTLDVAGAFSIALPATDSAALDPTGFGYTVTPRLHHENLDSVTFGLPQSLGSLDMADVTPADPDADYAPVLEGPSAYDVAVRNGFVGTEAAWLASLKGEPSTVPGPPGTTSWAGITDKPAAFPPETHAHSDDELTGLAPVAYSGTYADLAGKPAIPDSADDIGAETPAGAQAKADAAETDAKAASIPLTQKGAPSGVAPLGADSRVGELNLPAHLAQATQLATYASLDRFKRINPVATAKRGALPRIVSLMAGTEDEVVVAQNCTLSTDTVNWIVGGQGWKGTATGATVARLLLDPLPTAASATAGVTMPPAQAVCAWVYLEDATKVSELQLLLYGDDALTTGNRWAWFSTGQQTLVNGWNFVRVPATYSNLSGLATVYRAQVSINTTAATSFTVGHFYLECPTKARMLIVADRGYKTFDDNIYPRLKSRGIPVTFAVDCTLFGSQAGTVFEAMTLARMKEVAVENGNSISYHGYDGSPTSGMTAAQLRADTAGAIKFLQREFGENFGRMWRAAFVQGNAPQWASVVDLTLATAAGVTTSGLPDAWPPIHMHKIGRQALDNNTTTTVIDSWFSRAASTNMLHVVFMHGYQEGYEFDVGETNLAYFLTKLDAALAAGTMECVTFEQLFLESGGSFSQMGGAHVATYTAPDGTFVSKPVL